MKNKNWFRPSSGKNNIKKNFKKSFKEIRTMSPQMINGRPLTTDHGNCLPQVPKPGEDAVWIRDVNEIINWLPFLDVSQREHLVLAAYLICMCLHKNEPIFLNVHSAV